MGGSRTFYNSNVNQKTLEDFYYCNVNQKYTSKQLESSGETTLISTVERNFCIYFNLVEDQLEKYHDLVQGHLNVRS